MLLRFRTKEGLTRVSCEPNDTIESVVLNLIQTHLKKPVDSIDLESVFIQCNGSELIKLQNINNESLAQLSLKHGDMITMNYKERELGVTGNVPSSNSLTSVKVNGSIGSIPINNSKRQKLVELPVDVSLKKQSGFISRKRTHLCKHGDKGMCEYCSPLPPWDKDYHLEHGFKHISFHSYVKSLEEQSSSNKSKNLGASYIPPVSQPSYRIKKTISCQHDPWPKGICSKCQPSPITLKQQSFRMCDYVQFVESALINEFVDSWRQTGMQRFGILYGTYEEYNGTVGAVGNGSTGEKTKIDEMLPPLGVKALVQAIYEPLQHDEIDGITYDVENFQNEIEEVSQQALEFGIYPVGLIFSDLTDSGKGDGSVLCKRHKDSYFLSSLEVIMSSKFQHQYKNICHESEQGMFSSKFVTCCVTGNLNNEIEINSYQVSVEAESLVDADMISGSTHPSLAWINETNDKRYVPDIFYTKKNEYNLTVKENAKPAFPIEYLLITLSHGFTDSKHDLKLFKTVSGFPWKNREYAGFKQDFYELKKYFGNDINNDFDKLYTKLSNFHVLLYLKKCEILSKEEWDLVLKCAMQSSGNSTSPSETEHDHMLQLVSTPGWQTLVMILQESM